MSRLTLIMTGRCGKVWIVIEGTGDDIVRSIVEFTDPSRTRYL
jgi:hypothetical protein